MLVKIIVSKFKREVTPIVARRQSPSQILDFQTPSPHPSHERLLSSPLTPTPLHTRRLNDHPASTRPRTIPIPIPPLRSILGIISSNLISIRRLDPASYRTTRAITMIFDLVIAFRQSGVLAAHSLHARVVATTVNGQHDEKLDTRTNYQISKHINN